MELAQSLTMVVLVLALLGTTLVLLRKRGMGTWRFPLASPSPRDLQVVERIAIAPQHTLHLLKVSGRSILVATSPAGCQLLAHLDGAQGESE